MKKFNINVTSSNTESITEVVEASDLKTVVKYCNDVVTIKKMENPKINVKKVV